MLGVFTAGLALTIGFVLSLTATLSSLLAGLASAILTWVTSGNFITLSYTNARLTVGQDGFNAFVDLGWQLTRGLTNIIFVLALVAIGIATALRLGGTAYNFKKALPLLAIIALLINFTPVILGVMIDASNILMNFFLQGTGGFDFFNNTIKILNDEIMRAFGKFYDPAAQAQAVLTMLVITIVSLINAFIMFVFSALFVVRYIALWLLVILSPIAFACYILPATRKVWSQWWDQFVQWTIIGITGGFFLYLSSKMIELAGQGAAGGGKFFDRNAAEALVGDWGNFAAQIMPWFIIFFVMLIGLTMSFQTGAMGASAVRQGLSKSGGWLMKRRLAEIVKGRLAGAGAAALSGMAGANSTASRMIQKGGWQKAAGWAMKPFTRTTSPGMGALNNLWGRQMIEYAAGKRKAALPQNWDAMTDPEKVADVKSQTLDSDQLQGFAKMATEGSLKGLSDEKDQKYAGKLAKKFANNDYLTKYVDDIFDVLPLQKDEEAALAMAGRNKKGDAKKKAVDKAKKEIDDAIKNGKFSTDLTLKPAIDEESKRLMEEKLVATQDKANEQAVRNLASQYLQIKDLKSGDIKNLSKDTVKSAIFAKTLRDLAPGHLQAIQENFKADVFNEVMEKSFGDMFKKADGTDMADDEAQNTLDEYVKDPKHARMFQWFATNPIGHTMNFAGLKHMRDANGNQTDELNKYKERLEVERLLGKHPDAAKYVNALRRRESLAKELEKAEDTPANRILIDNDKQIIKDLDSGPDSGPNMRRGVIDKDKELSAVLGKIEKMTGRSLEWPKETKNKPNISQKDREYWQNKK